jgi:hypothetical protein
MIPSVDARRTLFMIPSVDARRLLFWPSHWTDCGDYHNGWPPICAACPHRVADQSPRSTQQRGLPPCSPMRSSRLNQLQAEPLVIEFLSPTIGLSATAEPHFLGFPPGLVLTNFSEPVWNFRCLFNLVVVRKRLPRNRKPPSCPGRHAVMAGPSRSRLPRQSPSGLGGMGSAAARRPGRCHHWPCSRGFHDALHL